MRLGAVSSLSARPLIGTWFRAIQPQFWTTPLQTSHTSTSATRFSPGNGRFEVFYLAENHLVALLEVGALVGTVAPGGLFPSPHRAWSILNVNVRLTSVVDLTRKAQRSSKTTSIRTSVQELTGDWRSYAIRHQLSGRGGTPPSAPTQQLGEALYRHGGIEAVKTYSAKQPFSSVLVVFPQRLAPTSRITFRDPVSGRTLSLP